MDACRKVYSDPLHCDVPSDRPLGRKQKPEGRSLAEDRVRPDCAAVHLHELFAEGQPEAGSLRAAARGAVYLAELLEQLRHVFPFDSDALVDHRYPDHILRGEPPLVSCAVGWLPEPGASADR